MIYAVTRILTTFTSDFNEPRTGVGTGFFLLCGDFHTPVTNRHVVDLSFATGSPGWRLSGLQVQVRRALDHLKHERETEFIDMDLERSKIVCSAEADVAAVGVDFGTARDDLTFGDIDLANVANQDFLQYRAQLMDIASFVGFPSSPTSGPWWDESWNTPIARLASLASLPGRAFVNRSIHTADVGLVSGLSLTGSSGSPLFLHAKGQRSMSLGDASYQPAKLIGIMSGHRPEVDTSAGPEMFRHSGLSYYTRATAIREVVQELAALRGSQWMD